MEAAGLLELWWTIYAADPTYCFRKIEKEVNDKKTEDSKKPLTFKELSGAFLVLGVGYSLAIATFIVELRNDHCAKIRNRAHEQSPANKDKKNVISIIISHHSTVETQIMNDVDENAV
jgi:hypothetical protein